MFALLIWFSLPRKIYAEILLALLVKDGMDKDVLNCLVLLDHGLMEPIVFALIPEINAYHGNYGMDKIVFTIKKLALLEPNGQVFHALRIQQVVLMDIIWMLINAFLCLRNAFLLLHGVMIDVVLLEAALMALSHQETLVNLILNVQMDKAGIQILYNALALKELDGVVKSVLFVQEVKFGIYGMDVLAQMDILWLDQSAKNLPTTCAN